MDTNVKRRKKAGSKPKSPPSLMEYTPASRYSALRIIVLILLPLFSAAGLFGTWILAGSNGTVAILEALAKQDVPLLPGSNDPLLKAYTGVGPIDRQLTILVVFFSPVLDPRNGALMLYSIFGLGQFGAAWTIMMMEGMRRGNKGKIVSFVGIVGFILQNITFTVTVPLWLFLHVLTSPVARTFPGSHASNALLISPLDLDTLPLTLILGYMVPSVLMALPTPSILSPVEHQNYIALWQPFPVWCVIIQTCIRYVVTTVTGDSKEDGPQKALETSYLNSAKRVYAFIICLCVITHLPVLLLAILPWFVFPDSAPHLQNLAENSFSSIYVPYFPTLAYQIPSFAAGVHTFLQWDLYIGGMAMLVWGIFLHRIAAADTSLPSHKETEVVQKETTWGHLAKKLGFWILLAGPSGALAVLLWERDTIVRQKKKQGI